MKAEIKAGKIPLKIGGVDIKTVEMPRLEYPMPVPGQGVVISSKRGVIPQREEQIQPEE